MKGTIKDWRESASACIQELHPDLQHKVGGRTWDLILALGYGMWASQAMT